MNSKNIAIIAAIAIIIIAGGVYASGLLSNSANNVAGSDANTVNVLAGAGFVKVTNDLKTEFEKKHPGVTVNVKNAGSAEIFGMLETQKTGDVFIPADYKYMEDAEKKGYVLNDTVKNITTNIPIIAVKKGNPKNINSLEDMTKSGVKVALGDPKGPAIGKTTEKILNKTNLTDEMKPNVVTYTTTVNQLLTYLITDQADAVIIWEDMATWDEGKGKIEVITIPKNQNIISTVPIATTVYAKNQWAAEFENFVVSPEGLAIWKKWGFEPIIK